MISRHLFLAVSFAAIAAVALPADSQAESVLYRDYDLGDGASPSLDPISPNRFYQANDLIYSRLIRQDENGEPAPELATRWTANETATEWTLTLQEGVLFHDGSTFDAADVKYSFERINDPALESPVASVLGMIDHVEVIDDLTAKIVLTSPHAGLVVLLMDYRVRMIPEGSGDTIGENANGTGPFKMDTYDPEGRTILVANEEYWEGRPKLDRIELIAIPDTEARIQALLAGQLDTTSVSRDQVLLFDGSEDFVLQNYPTGDWFGIIFRTDTPPFDDPRVRKAVRVAVDRDAMIKLMVGDGNGTITCDHPVMSNDPYRAEIDCSPNIEEAKRLLAEAGYPDGIEFDLYTSDLEPGMVRYAEVYQQQVAAAGITANVRIAPSDGYWEDVWMVEPVSMTSWSQRVADQILNEAYRSTSSWNESYFSNAQFDEYLDLARSSLDFEESKAYYGKAQELLFEEGGSFIAYFENGVRAVSRHVSGLPAVPEDYIRWHLVAKDAE
ncbi:MAG: ABC transporter substrate-binding protein [Dongiaceae bacterium]